MNKKYLALSFFFFIIFIIITTTQAYYTSETSASFGYYQDNEKSSHFPVYLYWNLNTTSHNDITTAVDVGVNNDAVYETWRFYIYHASTTIPLFEISKIQLGRQFIADGFEVGLLDGMATYLNWSENGGIVLTGGALHSVEQLSFSFDNQLYGLSAFQDFSFFTGRLGYFMNVREDKETLHLTHAAIAKSWDSLFWKPSILAKAQMNLEERDIEQTSADFQFSPWSPFQITLNFASQKRNHLMVDDAELIYSLFATSAQKTYGFSLNLLPHETTHFQLTSQLLLYDSPAKKDEEGLHERFIASWHPKDFFAINVTGGYLSSYGGHTWYSSLDFKKTIFRTLPLQFEVGAERIEKLNSIQMWAFHSRANILFPLSTRLSLKLLGEIERNHIFDIDAKAVVNVTYYL
ncbi:MAG: hypothetical protein HYS98_04095 [Deltaproteobacteria bacterium]|nr:hypothetical protein [Deltaproteobacteria bacterium]